MTKIKSGNKTIFVIENEVIVIRRKETTQVNGENKMSKSKWQTMETAPRDGTEFLYWEEDCIAPIGCFFSQTLLDFCENCFGKIIGVSDKGYWRPAPKLPKV